MAQSNQWTKTGQVLVEVLLALGLAALLLPALLTGLVSSRQGKAQQQQRTQATALLTEAVEATRSIREKGWTTFAVNGTFHPTISGSTWALVPTAENILGFTRSIIISDFLRNGSVDPSTKKVDVSVSWNTPLSATASATIYLTRYLDNLLYSQNTEADFKTGTLSGTTVTNTSGGEVTLGAGGQGDWCKPNLTIAALDLPKNGVANALTAIEGRAFAGTGDNASGVSFANVNISNAIPPVATIGGTYDGFKTNDIFGEPNYAYLATDNNSKEIEIINLTTNPYTEAGYFNAPGSGNGNSVYTSGTVGYMTSGNKFYSFDLSSKSGSRPQLGSVTLAGTGNSIVVVGSYAYVAIGGAAAELQIINIANPSSISIVGQADVNGQAAKDVFVNSTGTRAYLVTATSASQREFFIIDTATKTGNRPTVGSYDTNGMDPKGVTLVTGNRAIVVGHSAEEYQTINIATESAPIRCGGLNIDSGINGLASVVEQDGDAYSYIITGDSSSELKIIAGGPGGQYASSGTYESAFFDPGYSTAFNRLDVTYTKPANTNITFQVAIADPVSGSCANANYVFVDPDSTGAIPFNDDGVGYENPARCFKYRAYLSTSDFSSTPILEQVIVNYSP